MTQSRSHFRDANITLDRLRTRGNTPSWCVTCNSAWPLWYRGQPDNPVRVALVTSDTELRQTTTQELAHDLRTRLVSWAWDLREAKRLVNTGSADVFLVDLCLDDGSGLELLGHMKASAKSAKVIVISPTDDDPQALRAFELGASGWLVRGAWFCSFAQAVLQVANGGAAMTPGLVRQLLGRLERAGGHPASGGGYSVEYLTERETQVLSLVAHGLHSRQIGEELGISPDTVNAHIKSMSRKLDVHSRAQAVSVASEMGLLDAPRIAPEITTKATAAAAPSVAARRAEPIRATAASPRSIPRG